MSTRIPGIDRTLAAVLVSAFIGLLLSGCSLFGPQVETQTYETADGAIVVQSVELVATVDAIDAAKREVTINPKHGLPRVVKVHDAIDLGAIRVGDEIHVEVVEAVAVSLFAGGAPESAGELAAVALSPVGDKPTLTAVDTREVTVTIIGIDGNDHEITLEFVDGTTETIKVSRKIDLSELALGDSIRIAITDAVAIAVVKP